MTSKYCLCGKTNPVSANFCAYCGNKFANLEINSSTSVTKPTEISVAKAPQNVKPKSDLQERIDSFNKSKKVQRRQIESSQEDIEDQEYDDEEGSAEGEIHEVPNIDGLDVEISVPQPRRISVKDLESTGSEKSFKNMNYPSNSKKKISKSEIKKIINEFQKEGSSIRPK